MANPTVYASAALLTGTWMRASKLASYGMILSALLTQLACVKVLEGEPEVSEDKHSVDISNDADQPWSNAAAALLQLIGPVLFYKSEFTHVALFHQDISVTFIVMHLSFRIMY